MKKGPRKPRRTVLVVARPLDSGTSAAERMNSLADGMTDSKIKEGIQPRYELLPKSVEEREDLSAAKAEVLLAKANLIRARAERERAEAKALLIRARAESQHSKARVKSVTDAVAELRAAAAALQAKGGDVRFLLMAADHLSRPSAAHQTNLPLVAPVSRNLLSLSQLKVTVCDRLVVDWHRLADCLNVPMSEREAFPYGRGPQALWEWLESRGQLYVLPDALDFIGREDLAAELRNSPGWV